MGTIRALLAVTAVYDWTVVQMDVQNAFIHGDLSEIVYMRMPLGYTHKGCRIPLTQGRDYSHISTTPTLVCKLKRSLYGLKQAPRLWFSKLSSTLIELEFVQSKSDYSLFTKCKDDTITLVLVYVDDLLLASNSNEQIKLLKMMLSAKFHMKDLGNLRYFLGLEVDCSLAGFFVSQHKYLVDLLHEFNVEAATPAKILIDIHLRLNKHMWSH